LAKATKSGVRVSVLATELGLESKDIIGKLKGEGLDWARNHMSTLTFGQAETVREWVKAGELVSTGKSHEHADAAHEEAAHNAKAGKGGKKRKEGESDHDHDDHGGGTAVAEHDETETHVTGEEAGSTVVTAEVPATAAPVAETTPRPATEAPVAPTSGTTPVAPSAPALKLTPTVVAPPTGTPPPATTTTEAPAAPAKVAAEAPRPGGLTPAPVAPGIVARPQVGPGGVVTPVVRPVVSLRAGQLPPPVMRPPVTLESRRAAGQSQQVVAQFVPKPAQIQGPRVVREEKPDVVPAPRPRGPRFEGGGGTGGPTSFQPALPRGGAGVKRRDDEGEESAAEKEKKAKANSLSTRRRGSDGRRGEADEKLREFTDADLIERKERLLNATGSRAAFDLHLKKVAQRGTHAIAKSASEKGEPVEIDLPLTLRRLSETMGVKVNDLMAKLMRKGIMTGINANLDVETAQLIALDYGIELLVKMPKSPDEELAEEFDQRAVDPANLVTRPPVVTILGHVDHGKTSLLDKIRSANVAAGEAGGITQHIAAWTVEIGAEGAKKRVTFIDTPGHQAFTSMRARGANMTDVVVLVVAAVEGVMPQTIESINHARAAGVPIVVALNKIDRPDANPDMVLGQLAANGLNPTEWGGDIEVVRTSAVTGQGIPELIEILDLQSQIMELKSDPTAPAMGRVIESQMVPGLGAAATVLVQGGTLKVGDIMLVGGAFGRVRSLLNDKGTHITEAGPSTPVIVAGLNGLPQSGERFYVLSDYERARTIADQRANQNRQTTLAGQNRLSGASLFKEMTSAVAVKTINLIIKGDAQGSVETLVATVTAQNTEEVQVKVIHSGVGAISESDVELAMATRINPEDPSSPRKVAIIGFHVVPDESARAAAEQNHIDVKTYRVIYEIFDDLKKSLSGLLEPEIREKLHGHVEIRRVYKVSRVGNIAGCFVTDGHISRGSKIRLIRDGKVITEDLTIETLKRLKDDVKEVKAGLECGIKLAGYDDIKEADVLEGYIREKFERTL